MVKLSQPMEDALFGISDADGGKLPGWIKTNTVTALVKRGLAQWGGEVCTLTAEGAAEVLRLRPVTRVMVPVVEKKKLNMKESVGKLLAPVTRPRVMVPVVESGFMGIAPATVGKLCKVKKSSAGRRAKWRKGR